MMHKYYTLRRPPMPGGIPSGAIEAGELEDRIRINGLGTAWGYVVYDHELTMGELADYELAYWEAVEVSEADPALAPVEVNEIAPDHITLANVEMPATYRVSSTGRSVTVVYEIGGDKFRFYVSGQHGEFFTAALEAANRGNTTPVNGEDLALILSEAVHLEKREKPAEINPDKQRHGEVPEKWFVGQALEGKSWRIVFDGDAGKTRVIFPRKPSTKVLEAVKAAGFYWSPSMQSWNKGLTWKAYRAAEKLHAELHKLAA